jgi:hypothetical protein
MATDVFSSSPSLLLGEGSRKGRMGGRRLHSADRALASFGRFHARFASPQIPHRLPMASFRRIHTRIVSPQIRYRSPLGSFGRFQLMIISLQNPHRLSLGSFRKMGARLNRGRISKLSVGFVWSISSDDHQPAKPAQIVVGFVWRI